MRKGRPSRRCYCYIVECADGSFYTGWTTDPAERIRAHNKGRGSRYTRSRRPVMLVMLEIQSDRSEAMKRERAIKGMTRARKQRLIDESSGAATALRRIELQHPIAVRRE